MTPGYRVLFLNRSYWPEIEATGQLLTELLEDLAPRFRVAVIPGQPNQNPGRERYCAVGRERRRGVTIHRVFSFRFPKRRLFGRACNLLSYFVSAFATALYVDRPDAIVVETDPPVLSLLGDFLRHWHGCKLVVYLQDIYPDLAVGLGKIPDAWWVRWLRSWLFRIYRSADRVVVLSRDMRELLVESGVPASKIECIPNWVDARAVYPVKDANPFRARHGINGEFVVMYSGNLGMTQPLEHVLLAADRLRDRSDVVVFLVGNGALKPSLEKQANELGLANVKFLDYQAKTDLATSLSAADLHLIPLHPRLARCLMPSKLYGILASGTAILAPAPAQCELGETVRGGNVGLVVSPEDSQALAEAIRWCADHRDAIQAMGQAARALAVQRFDRPGVTARFAELLMRTCDAKPKDLATRAQ